MLAYRAASSGTTPYVSQASPGPNATGVPANAAIEVDIHDSAGSQVAQQSVTLTLDGVALSPAPTVTKTNGLTIAKSVPDKLFSSNSVHTLALAYSYGSPAVNVNRSWTFTVTPYATISDAVDDTKLDKTKVGFLVHPYQVDGSNGTQPNTLQWTEDMFTGKYGTNIADLSGANAAGYYAVTNVINFDITAAAADGHFNDPDYPDSPFPGIPGSGGGTDNAAVEVITLLAFPSAGYYTMGVNSDDGFRVSTAAPDPRPPAAAVSLGQFDGGRGAADTFFGFNVAAAGVYPVRLIWENGTGGANCEWFTVQPDGSFLLVNDTKPGAIKAYQFQTLPLKQGGRPPPSISGITLSSGKINITWTTGATLQSAANVTGPWADVAGATSPYSATPTAARMFYRLKL